MRPPVLGPHGGFAPAVAHYRVFCNKSNISRTPLAAAPTWVLDASRGSRLSRRPHARTHTAHRYTEARAHTHARVLYLPARTGRQAGGSHRRRSAGRPARRRPHPLLLLRRRTAATSRRPFRGRRARHPRLGLFGSRPLLRAAVSQAHATGHCRVGVNRDLTNVLVLAQSVCVSLSLSLSLARASTSCLPADAIFPLGYDIARE